MHFSRLAHGCSTRHVNERKSVLPEELLGLNLLHSSASSVGIA